MPTLCRFSLLTVKEFLHKSQQGVGRWSNLVNVAKERPFNMNNSVVSGFTRTFFLHIFNAEIEEKT